MSKDTKKKVEEVEEKDEELDEEDEDEEEEEEGEDEEDEDDGEEERNVAAAKPVARRAAVPASKQDKHEKHAKHDDHGHGHDDEDDETDLDDPTWWAPYAVMTTLVLIGVLGFFGVFNKPLAFLAAKPKDGSHTSTTKHEDAHKGATAPPPATGRPNPHAGHGHDQPGQPPREMFGAKHLLVMYKGSRRAPPAVERSKEEAKTRATEAMKKAKAPGAKFEDLVKEYSDEPNAGARGGDLGKFPRGAMVPEFQTALDKMKVGEVSDLVETPFGYHVILRTQ